MSSDTSDQSSALSRIKEDQDCDDDSSDDPNDAFESMINGWMGDELSFMSGDYENDSTGSQKIVEETKKTKKKIVPISHHVSQSTVYDGQLLTTKQSSTQTTPVCYLLLGSLTQATLIEHYSPTPPTPHDENNTSTDVCLARWSIPQHALSSFPKYKFTQNFGKSELCNYSKGDLRGKRSYYSGICQWLRVAKTWNGHVTWMQHVPGWECDIYAYLNDEGQQTVLINDGHEFPIHLADGVAVVPRGSDFIHYDPRFRCDLDKWVSEGSKLGFATKLDVRAGCAIPTKGVIESMEEQHRAIGDAARPSGGASYSSLVESYARRKELSEFSRMEANEQRLAATKAKETAELQAVKVASKHALRDMKELDERERLRIKNGETVDFDATRLDASAGISSSVADKSHSNYKDDAFVFSPSRMLVGTQVYIRDVYYSWVPATIESPEDDKKRLKVRVCLPDGWEESTIIHEKGKTSMTLDRVVKLSDYPNNELPLQNIFLPNDVIGKDDVADLANLHEAAILYNLKARHKEGNPYTRVGDITVAMNPFQWIDGLYSGDKQLFYANSLIWKASGQNTQERTSQDMNVEDHPRATAASERQALGYDYEKLGIHPHVYETSSLAYLGLANDHKNQAILVTGESGAGKTETIKIVMNHLATVERSRPSWPDSDRYSLNDHGSESVVNRVVRSNPLFEAFGNAKTLRNDNSSRFGKFTQLQFDVETTVDAHRGGREIPSCHLVGSKCTTYLLEKSRVVSVSEGERTYHIFYQLIGAPTEAKEKIWEEGLVGSVPSDFTYLNSSSVCPDGLASGENWIDTVDALSIFGINDELFLNLMRSLCIILQLGNIVFDSELVNGEERSCISSFDELRKLSDLMGVPESRIETAMTKRFMVTRGEEFTISLRPSEAKDGCDAFAKEIYARIFDFLVHKINEFTEPSERATEYGTISLLDIFGFESFAVNRFEQLCINYANERLQQKYVIDNFQSVKIEYEEEGINVFDFSLIDNSEVIELLEGKLGLIAQLNEECVRPSGSDESFVYKLKVVNSDSSCLLQDKLHFPYEFAIRHYAAPIKYDSRRFIERNLDKIPSDLLECACQSKNPLFCEQFQILFSKLKNPPNALVLKKRSEVTKDLVTSKFKGQLTSLMSLIEKSRTRYIRCVKPNKRMIARVTDHSHTVSQLESAGLVTAIVISRESFPNRLSYELVMERFKFLTYKYSDCKLGSGDVKTDTEILLSHLLAGITVNTHKGTVQSFTCGKTKVYFRVGALERIETVRQEYYAERAVQLETWVRKLRSRQRYISLKSGMILFQCAVRRWSARNAFNRAVRCVIIIQCFIRKTLASMLLSLRRREHATIVIQARWRVMKPRHQFYAMREAVISIQSYLRMVVCRKAFAANQKESEEEAVIESRMIMIQQNFDDASTIQGTVFSVDEGLLEEVETMFEFLRKEIVVLRKKNSALKKQLAESEADKREIYNQASNIDHSYALSKIRAEQMTKTNAALQEDNNRRRKEASKLKSELKLQQQAHGEQLNQMRSEFELALAHREMDLKTLQANHNSAITLHRREMQMIHEEADRKQEDNNGEIFRLRDEIKRTQESHQTYLAKLMDVLETTQASRRFGSSSVDEELIRKKDAEIARLNEELNAVQNNHRTSIISESDGLSANKKEAVKSMVYSVKRNREQRKTRVQQLQVLTDQLEERIGGGDPSQLQGLIQSIKGAINAGEKANSKMDRDMVNMIDFSSMYVTPDASCSEDVDALLSENQKLRKKLEKKSTCKKCGHTNRNREKKEDKSQTRFGGDAHSSGI